MEINYPLLSGGGVSMVCNSAGRLSILCWYLLQDLTGKKTAKTETEINSLNFSLLLLSSFSSARSVMDIPGVSLINSLTGKI